MADDDKRVFVAKGNALVDAFYKLSLIEHQLIAYSISCIERNDIPRKGNLPVHINLAKFKALFGVEHLSLKRVMDGVNRLYERSVHIYDPGKGEHIRHRWLGEVVEYTKANDELSIVFYERVVPHLTGLKAKGNYTMYLLDMVADFKCQHTFHVWEILAKSRNMKKDIVVIPIDLLRKKLGLEDKYKEFPDFNKRVIKPVFEDLTNCTKLNIDYELIKKGRSYTAIQVIFKEDKEALPPKKKASTKKAKAKVPAKLTKEYINRHAKPGESYEQATARLRCKDTIDFINEKADAELVE